MRFFIISTTAILVIFTNPNYNNNAAHAFQPSRSILRHHTLIPRSLGSSTSTSTSTSPQKPFQSISYPVVLQMSSSEDATTSNNISSKMTCPVTTLSNNVEQNLSIFDKLIFKRILRLINHAPALLSLSYFGLVSMASMMSMGPMSAAVAGTSTVAKGAKVAKATLASVLTQSVGSTTNAQFAALFPTYVTPAPFVFLVWPTIAILQLLTVTVSAIYPISDDDDKDTNTNNDDDDEILTQNDLSALTIANLFSTAWLISASNASPNALPISSCLLLPFVPLSSGFTLRNKPKYVLLAYQLFSSFTTLASILAFTVEIQHGGRIPLIGKVGAEVAGCVFLSLYSIVSLAVKEKSKMKKFVNWFALSGILVRRVTDAMTMVPAAAVSGMAMFGAVGRLFLSVSFLGTIGCWYWALKELFASSPN